MADAQSALDKLLRGVPPYEAFKLGHLFFAQQLRDGGMPSAGEHFEYDQPRPGDALGAEAHRTMGLAWNGAANRVSAQEAPSYPHEFMPSPQAPPYPPMNNPKSQSAGETLWKFLSNIQGPGTAY